jgi:hypothetical protein
MQKEESKQQAKLLALADLENLLALSESSLKYMTTMLRMDPLGPSEVNEQVTIRIVEML